MHTMCAVPKQLTQSEITHLVIQYALKLVHGHFFLSTMLAVVTCSRSFEDHLM